MPEANIINFTSFLTEEEYINLDKPAINYTRVFIRNVKLNKQTQHIMGILHRGCTTFKITITSSYGVFRVRIFKKNLSSPHFSALWRTHIVLKRGVFESAPQLAGREQCSCNNRWLLLPILGTLKYVAIPLL